ncbi:SRPBCC family protein [Planktotalea sp.]|uniref:SRPBCC family protein n=1 Tax=Planktotalea sp. TaxID=2029877 RepID=UPI003297D3E4
MPKTISLTHHYTSPADLVWQVATDLDHLKEVTKSLLSYKNMPSRQIYEGQHLTVDVSLFGKMPYQPYEMTVEKLDHETRSFASFEKGAGVKSWQHRLQVIEDAAGSRIEESIEIDAGVLTPVFAMWAKFMYNKRHAPRLEILKRLEARL